MVREEERLEARTRSLLTKPTAGRQLEEIRQEQAILLERRGALHTILASHAKKRRCSSASFETPSPLSCCHFRATFGSPRKRCVIGSLDSDKKN